MKGSLSQIKWIWLNCDLVTEIIFNNFEPKLSTAGNQVRTHTSHEKDPKLGWTHGNNFVCSNITETLLSKHAFSL